MATQTAFSQASSTQVTEAFFQGIGDGASLLDSLQQVCKIERDDVASLKKAAMQGISLMADWDGVSDPASDTLATVSSSYQQTITYKMLMLNVRLPSHDAMDVPNLISESSQKLGFAVANTLASEGWGQVAKMWTHDGADGKPPIDAAHPITGGTFDNKNTTTMDAAALASTLVMLRRFKDLEGSTLDAAIGGNLALVCSPELERTAAELVVPGFSGTDLSSNFFRGYNMSVVSSPYISDANDYAIVRTDHTPVRLWIRDSPSVTQYLDQPSNTVNLRVQCALAGYFNPPGYHYVVGNTPA